MCLFQPSRWGCNQIDQITKSGNSSSKKSSPWAQKLQISVKRSFHIFKKTGASWCPGGLRRIQYIPSCQTCESMMKWFSILWGRETFKGRTFLCAGKLILNIILMLAIMLSISK